MASSRRKIPEHVIRELESFFSEGVSEEDNGVIIRCVVTGKSDPHWHHLDDNPRNNQVGNIIPLSWPVNIALGEMKRWHRPMNREHKDLPTVEQLMARARQWEEQKHLARAYGCVRLAYSCSKTPYGNARPRELMEIACKAIRYLRHRVCYPILNTTLQDIANVFRSVRSAKIEVIIGLVYDLAALLNEHGEWHRAGLCAQQILSWWKRYSKYCDNLDRAGSILRRAVQVIQITSPRSEISKLIQELDDMAHHNRRLMLSVANSQALAAMNSSNPREVSTAYDSIASLCEELEPLINRRKLVHVGPSDVAEVFFNRSVLAAKLDYPKGASREDIHYWCHLSTELFARCHAKITNQYVRFWGDVFKSVGICDHSEKDPIVAVYKKFRRGRFPEDTSNLVDSLFHEACRVAVLY